MRRTLNTAVLVGFALTLAMVVAAADNPYRRPLKAKGFSAQAVSLPPRTVGQTVMRSERALAVEIRIPVEGYLPRGLEPTLLIDGKPTKAASRVVGAQGQVTTLGFLIEDPGLLKEGARLALQMGGDSHTRSSVPGALRRGQIRPLESVTERESLPSLNQWLRQAKPSSK